MITVPLGTHFYRSIAVDLAPDERRRAKEDVPENFAVGTLVFVDRGGLTEVAAVRTYRGFEALPGKVLAKNGEKLPVRPVSKSITARCSAGAMRLFGPLIERSEH